MIRRRTVGRLDPWVLRSPFGRRAARRYRAQRPGFGDLDQRLLARLGDVPPGLLVDVGAGDGQLSQALRGASGEWSVVAVEPSRAFCPPAPCVRARAEALPLADDSAVAAIFLSSLRHVRDRALALREARRVVRPGGRLVVVELDPDAGPSRVARHLGAMRSITARAVFAAVVLATCPPVETWVNLASDAGWRRIAAVADELQPVTLVTAS